MADGTARSRPRSRPARPGCAGSRRPHPTARATNQTESRKLHALEATSATSVGGPSVYYQEGRPTRAEVSEAIALKDHVQGLPRPIPPQQDLPCAHHHTPSHTMRERRVGAHGCCCCSG
jgi:hypothetical protein